MVTSAPTFPTASSEVPTPSAGGTIPPRNGPSQQASSLRRLRADAHAAFHSVEGAETAALDAALAVIESQWLATRAERDSYAEALKTIRLYGRDPDDRALAGRVLS